MPVQLHYPYYIINEFSAYSSNLMTEIWKNSLLFRQPHSLPENHFGWISLSMDGSAGVLPPGMMHC